MEANSAIASAISSFLAPFGVGVPALSVLKFHMLPASALSSYRGIIIRTSAPVVPAHLHEYTPSVVCPLPALDSAQPLAFAGSS